MNGRLTSILATAALLTATNIQAATLAHQWQITPFAGYTMFNESKLGALGTLELKDSPYYGARIGYQFSRYLGIEAAGGFISTSLDTTGGQDIDITHYSGNLIFSAPLGHPADLFLTGGWGTAKAKPDVGSEQNNSTLEVAGGVRWWMSNNVGLRFEARNISPINGDKAVHSAVLYGAGLVFGFGGKVPDADADGIPDNKDKCPNTPAGAKVDANGCPLDTDADGIFDGLDQCPGTPAGARVDARGCTVDGDGDGVPDGIDQCDNTPTGATVDARGCPNDSDGDGVPDGLDRCANTPTGAVVGPDGCPKDSDGDGVPDGLDKCPDTAAGMRVDKDGCAIIKSEIQTELLDTGMIRISNINFATGKAELQPESFGILNDVGAILTKWPELKFEIGGHTDARGSAAANQTLSEARANSVRDYMLQHFPNLTADTFVVKGYGESKPVAKNDTPEHMAKNRRVEFVVLNKDELKRIINK